MKEMFSYFKDGITQTKPTKNNWNIPRFLTSLGAKTRFKFINQIRRTDDKEERTKLKRLLPYVTFSGTFKKREKTGLIESSGFACFDFDDVENLEELKSKLSENKYSHLIFISPSGNGLKLVVKIPKVKDDSEYKKYWLAIAQHYNISSNDKAAKDICRACYLSYDKTPYYNADSEVFNQKTEERLQPAAQQDLSEIKSIEVNKDFLIENIIPKLSQEIQNLILLKTNVKDLEKHKLPSRSERDSKIIVSLLYAGAGDYIKSIFENFECGNKYREHSNPEKYLETSIKNAREFTGINNDLIPYLEKELESLDSGVLKNKVDEYLLKILKVKEWIKRKYFISKIAYKIKTSKKDLERRLKELEDSFEIKNPVSVKELLSKPLKETEFFLEPLIPKGHLILIGGKPTKFKSMLCLSLARSLRQDNIFLDNFKIKENPKILLYDLENGSEITSWRLKYLVNGAKKETEGLEDFKIEEKFNKLNMEKEIELASNYDVIILDSFRRFLEGSENDSEITDRFFELFLKPLKKAGKTIIIIHHFKKHNLDDISDEDILDLFRGSSDIPSQFEEVFGVFTTPEIINSEKKETKFQVSLIKSKNRTGLPIRNFTFEVLKNDRLRETTLKFLDWTIIKSPKQLRMDKILEFLRDGDKNRTEIIKEMKKETPSEWTIIGDLTEMAKKGMVKRKKHGLYSLDFEPEKVDKAQTKLNGDKDNE